MFRYKVSLRDGFFQLNEERPETEWHHMVLNYIGPEEGQGITLYNNGIRTKTGTTKKDDPAGKGNGKVVIGKFYTDRNERYSNVEMDELYFFNQALDSDLVSALMNNT